MTEPPPECVALTAIHHSPADFPWYPSSAEFCGIWLGVEWYKEGATPPPPPPPPPPPDGSDDDTIDLFALESAKKNYNDAWHGLMMVFAKVIPETTKDILYWARELDTNIK